MRVKTATPIAAIANVFQALSDETRLLILEQLKEGEQCVCDLTDAFKTGQSRLSFHLRVLKEAGLVLDRPEGRWVYYSLNPNALEDLQEAVNALKAPPHRASKKGCCP
ncbi:MAG: winged helix-turn-helix transcriptional regulator [Rhodocyclaceae bacterium]|nr:winged helix-turn-helix transcriptional regulator [Rhodocyclaceae bacterium]